MNGPLLWFANRGTGLVLLVLLTLTAVLGVLATRGRAGRAGGPVPRFVTQTLHRNLSLLAVVLLAAHVVSAVADEYADIRWWQALVPYGATYKPLWLELGTAALDVLVLVVVTSLLRHRLPQRGWRLLHLGAYAAWGLAVVHGLGIGTDSQTSWGRWTTLGCVAAVGLAGLVRLGGTVRATRLQRRASDAPVPVVPAGAHR